MQLILSEADSCRPQREERDSLEHWEDDGGASGQEPPISFSVAFIDDRSNRLSLYRKDSLAKNRLYGEMQPVSAAV